MFALNIVGFPINELPKSILTNILQGGIDKAKEADIPIVGGHSVDDKEPKYGLVVTGEINGDKVWKNSEAKDGDVILLTKPLGTGIIASGIKKGLVPNKEIKIASNSMKTLNKHAADILEKFKSKRCNRHIRFWTLRTFERGLRKQSINCKYRLFKDPIFAIRKEFG